MEHEATVDILLVDDQPANLLALEAVLESLGQNLVKAHSGEEALRHLIQKDFAVILLDVLMPGMNGFETAALIRQRDRSRHMPIIFLTAGGKTETEMFQGYAVGAIDYLLKPIRPAILRSKVLVLADLYRKNGVISRLREELGQKEREFEALDSAFKKPQGGHGSEGRRTPGGRGPGSRAGPGPGGDGKNDGGRGQAMIKGKTPVNILLVDDQPANLLALEAILESLGQNLVKANSGGEALRQLIQKDFAVILLDVLMPGMNGFETAALIRKRDRSSHMPIIFLTAGGKTETEMFQAYAVGAIDYLLKPVAPAALQSKVSVLIDLHRRAEETGRLKDELDGKVKELVILNLKLEIENRKHDLTLEKLRRSEAELKTLNELQATVAPQRTSPGEGRDRQPADAASKLKN
jgi:CheY-like chemotaxis protein